MTGVEQWMINSEDKINRIFDLILTGNTTSGIFLNIFMIALLPAIGEELIFRGVLLNILNRLFKSGHIAVWVTAIIFSSIHLQFYGFLPRLILGLFFGYLFFWSGTLWLPVVAHFVNNAVSTIGSNISSLNMTSQPAEISLTIQLFGLTLSISILCVIMNYFRKRSKSDVNPGGGAPLTES
jgi:membrane protease YdiL (CAAX protease family)